MLANIAIYRIKPEYLEIFQRRMRVHAETSLRDEPGCVRFDVNQGRDDPTQFLMYEVFRDEDAWEAHRSSPHAASFVRDRDAEGWLAERTVYQLNQIYSADKA